MQKSNRRSQVYSRYSIENDGAKLSLTLLTAYDTHVSGDRILGGFLFAKEKRNKIYYHIYLVWLLRRMARNWGKLGWFSVPSQWRSMHDRSR